VWVQMDNTTAIFFKYVISLSVYKKPITTPDTLDVAVLPPDVVLLLQVDAVLAEKPFQLPAHVQGSAEHGGTLNVSEKIRTEGQSRKWRYCICYDLLVLRCEASALASRHCLRGRSRNLTVNPFGHAPSAEPGCSVRCAFSLQQFRRLSWRIDATCGGGKEILGNSATSCESSIKDPMVHLWPRIVRRPRKSDIGSHSRPFFQCVTACLTPFTVVMRVRSPPRTPQTVSPQSARAADHDEVTIECRPLVLLARRC